MSFEPAVIGTVNCGIKSGRFVVVVVDVLLQEREPVWLVNLVGGGGSGRWKGMVGGNERGFRASSR